MKPNNFFLWGPITNNEIVNIIYSCFFTMKTMSANKLGQVLYYYIQVLVNVWYATQSYINQNLLQV